ncbi:MAG: alpha/beta hydrolase [Limnothrix sp.]
MATVSIRGATHFYEWIGRSPDASSQKPVMVFVHGWGGSSHYWRSTATAFSHNFDCLIYDLRGFGQSVLSPEYIGEYGLQDYVFDLLELLNQLKTTQKFVLNAHSMGASIGALFAEQYPQRVEKLILNCSGIFEYDERAFAIFQKIGGDIVRFRFPWLKQIPLMDRMAIARFLAQPISVGDRRQFLDDFFGADSRAAAGTLVGAVNKEMVTRLPAAFRNLQCPTLFLSGEKDQIIPAAQAQQAIALNPNFQYVEIPNVGHFPMLENFDLYQQTIRQFLEK